MAIRFTFRQLEYFVGAGKAGSVTGAAEKINISPPSISAAIAQLENEFGVDLFVRHHAQGLSLTTGGQIFFREAKMLLAYAEGLRYVAEDIKSQVGGQLTIGCLVTLSPFILPEIRRGFVLLYPEASVRQVEAHQVDLFQNLRRAEIDVAITYDLELPQDINFEPLAILPPHAIFSPEHPFAEKKSVSLQSLSELPYVLLDLPLSRDYFLSLFQKSGLSPNIAERTAHLPMVRTLVANNFGYGLLNIPSKNIHAPDGKALKSVKLDGDHRPMKLGLLTIKSDRKPRILTAFEAFCRECITTESAPGMTKF